MKILPHNDLTSLQLLIDKVIKQNYNKNWNYGKVGNWSIRWNIKTKYWMFIYKNSITRKYANHALKHLSHEHIKGIYDTVKHYENEKLPSFLNKKLPSIWTYEL